MNLLERLGEGRVYARAPVHPSGADYAVRFNPPAPFCDGYEDAYLVDDDVVLATQIKNVHEDFADTEPGLGRLIFAFHLSGRRIINFSDFATIEMRFPSLTIFCVGEGVPRCSMLAKGASENVVSVGAHPDRLVRRGLPASGRFLDGVAHVSEGRRPATWLQLPLSADMKSAAGAALHPPVGAKHLQLYLHAKAQELLALAFEAVERNSAAAAQTGCDESRKFNEAVRFVEDNLHRQIALKEIAKEVQARPEAVSRWFSDRFGGTVQDYAARARMTRACALMASTEMPLKQIAYEAGYNHTSNFCIAFKKTFGVTPGQARTTKDWPKGVPARSGDRVRAGGRRVRGSS